MPGELGMTVIGDKEVVQKLRAFGERANKALVHGLWVAAARVLRRAQKIIYLGHEQGHLNIGVGYLRQGLAMDVDERQLCGYVGVRNNVPYGAIHEFGGVIRPVRAPALMFQIDGHWVRTQSVTIPPRPYLQPALEEEQDGVRKDILHALEEVLP